MTRSLIGPVWPGTDKTGPVTGGGTRSANVGASTTRQSGMRATVWFRTSGRRFLTRYNQWRSSSPKSLND
jgi:hypothetical protein